MKTSPAGQAMPEHSMAERLLRNADVRVTAARLSVLDVLLLQKRALSHLEVQDALPDLDRVTLYRALDCLTDAGLTHKIAGDDRVFRYSTGNEAAAGQPELQHQHGHFKCTVCARVFCLDEAQLPATLRTQLQAALQSTLGTGFRSHDIELTIKGCCDRCSKSGLTQNRPGSVAAPRRTNVLPSSPRLAGSVLRKPCK